MPATDPGGATGRKYPTAMGVAVLLLAVGIVLRQRALAPRSLWLDDAWPALVDKVPWRQVGVVGLTSPGFSVVLKVWLQVVGFSSLRAQVPAFVCGVIGPVALYFLARRMRLSGTAAFVAAAIMLVSPAHIVYSTRVKQYTLDSLLAMLVIAAAV